MGMPTVLDKTFEVFVLCAGLIRQWKGLPATFRESREGSRTLKPPVADSYNAGPVLCQSSHGTRNLK